MPQFATKYFGTLEYESSDLFDFPQGLPAFEQHNCFVPLNLPTKRPLVFLQSTQDSQLCFIGLPVLVVESQYELSVSYEDLSILELERDRQPHMGSEVLVLSLLSIADGQLASANLMAPVVLNLAKRIGVQAIRCDFRYSHRHPFIASEALAC